MNKLIVTLTMALTLTGCAQTPEQAAAMRQFGLELYKAGAYNATPQPIQMPSMGITRCDNVFGVLECRSF